MAKKFFHVRWSSIKTWRTCPKKYQYSWIDRLEPRRPPSPLIRGTMIGQCLDKRAEGESFEPILEFYEKEYGKLFKSEQEEYGDIVGEVRRIVTNYGERYEDDGLVYQLGKDGKPYELEVEVRMVVGEIKVLFSGHLDKLPIDHKGRLLVMDHKSHKSIPGVNARYNDLQLLTYIWLLPLSGYKKPDGVLWDYLRTKPPTVPELLKKGGLTRRANIDTDYKTYYKAIEENDLNPDDYKEELKRLEDQGDNRYFERVTLPAPSQGMIDNMVHDFKRTIIEMHDAEYNHKHFVRNMSRDCNNCMFYKLCQAELRGLDTTFMRKADYKERAE